jgi:hypothetical protein
MESKVVIILGMGRSGTSFTANWLNKCGLYIGESFLAPNYNNVTGFYEDIDILKFQQEILTRNMIKNPLMVGLQSNILIDEADIEKAKKIIQVRNLNQWGWKDPRTVLLMKDLWSGIIPNAKLVIVYRPYWEVVDSIMRADWKSQKNRKNKLIAWVKLMGYQLKINHKKRQNKYLEAWIRFNLNILEVITTKEDKDILITSVENLLKDSVNIHNSIISKFNLNIDYIDPHLIFNDELFINDSKLKPLFNPKLKLMADSILKELNKLYDNQIIVTNH